MLKRRREEGDRDTVSMSSSVDPRSDLSSDLRKDSVLLSRSPRLDARRLTPGELSPNPNMPGVIFLNKKIRIKREGKRN